MLCPCQGPSVQNSPRTNFEVDFEPAGANMKTTCGSMSCSRTNFEVDFEPVGANMKTTCGSMSCSVVNPKLGTKCGTANTSGYQVMKNNWDAVKIKTKVCAQSTYICRVQSCVWVFQTIDPPPPSPPSECAPPTKYLYI
jgi:hypothetical protein